MPYNIIRLPVILERSGLSRSTIYLMMSRDEFPASVSLGERAVGWIESEFEQWLEDRIAASRDEQ